MKKLSYCEKLICVAKTKALISAQKADFLMTRLNYVMSKNVSSNDA